jgi:hypothetical protein
MQGHDLGCRIEVDTRCCVAESNRAPVPRSLSLHALPTPASSHPIAPRDELHSVQYLLYCQHLLKKSRIITRGRQGAAGISTDAKGREERAKAEAIRTTSNRTPGCPNLSTHSSPTLALALPPPHLGILASLGQDGDNPRLVLLSAKTALFGL